MPHFRPHEALRFDVSLEWTTVSHSGDRTATDHATVKLAADTEVSTRADGAMVLVQHFETPTVTGDGPLGDELRRTGDAIVTASVSTTIAVDGRVLTSHVDGASDESVRAIALNLGQLVSFRFLRTDPVAVGDEWDKTWPDTASGTFDTGAHYRLDQIVTCGSAKCGVIEVSGRDSDAKSTFHAELTVELDSLRPVRKHVESTTTVTGDQNGAHYDLETRTILTANRL